MSGLYPGLTQPARFPKRIFFAGVGVPIRSVPGNFLAFPFGTWYVHDPGPWSRPGPGPGPSPDPGRPFFFVPVPVPCFDPISKYTWTERRGNVPAVALIPDNLKKTFTHNSLIISTFILRSKKYQKKFKINLELNKNYTYIALELIIT